MLVDYVRRKGPFAREFRARGSAGFWFFGDTADVRERSRSMQYDPGMSERKTRVTVTIDPHLAAYAERVVESGKADSVSAVVNDALEARRQRDARARRLWKELTAQADRASVDRMLAHIEAQRAQLPPSHR
jgi:Arc/MetJ-type ribon-helix-helix transcriptional regulator